MTTIPTRQTLAQRIADAIGANPTQVDAAVTLLDGGATVPFIARYRKEVTGGLSDTQLRALEERLGYLREFDRRRDRILEAIAADGKLDEGLRARIEAADTKAELEDLYLPFKKTRRTKAVMAIEAGLEPLADRLWQSPELDPLAEAERFVDPDKAVPDAGAALDGARTILMERFAVDATLTARLREILRTQGFLCSRVQAGKQAEGVKFRDYFDHQEKLSKVPGHRALAMFRGRAEGFLGLKLQLPENDAFGDDKLIEAVARHVGFVERGQPADTWRAKVVAWTWKVKLSSRLETELFVDLRERADAEAISIFAANLRDLLLAAPAGPRVTLGLDPGFRSGVKVTVIDATGKVVDHTAVFPHQPQNRRAASLAMLADLCRKYSVELVAIGNGTASRETEKLVDDLIREPGLSSLTKVVVSEAGASVYSASEAAEREFPELDVTIRGAISIARRLQDPLAELVKIDPAAIGVGQYQHDVSQSALARSLDATVEDCVNGVGVELGTASAALLTRVAGLTPTIAANIVAWRDENGAFETRKTLKKVPRLGDKAFEQAAGFLRIATGADPLDASGVHPESYPVVARIVAHVGKPLAEIIGNAAILRTLEPALFTDERFGLPTVKDIIVELEKPGRDPRPEFKTARFAEGVEKIGDLIPDQVLEGQVTNVTAFGAFVDIGVHQDGLVHISALSEQYVKDPRDIVKTGDIVKVKVLQVDVQRGRIGLTMRLSDSARAAEDVSATARGSHPGKSGLSAARRQPDARRTGSKGARDQRQHASPPSALAESLKAALAGKGD